MKIKFIGLCLGMFFSVQASFAQVVEEIQMVGTVLSVSETEIVGTMVGFADQIGKRDKGFVIDRFTGSEIMDVQKLQGNSGVYLPLPDKPLGIAAHFPKGLVNSAAELMVGDMFIATVKLKQFSPAEEQLKANPRH